MMRLVTHVSFFGIIFFFII